MIDREQRRDHAHFPEPARQAVRLVKALDVALKEQKATRLDQFDHGAVLGREFPSGEPDNEKLTYFLLKSKMRIPHWTVSAFQAFLYGCALAGLHSLRSSQVVIRSFSLTQLIIAALREA